MKKNHNHNSKQQKENSVKVLIRVRPLISIQQNTHNIVSVAADEQSVIIFVDNHNRIQTKFDKVIAEYKNQRNVFDYVSPSIDRILDGYNMTIFAYGQTGSGKTFTMFGKDWQNTFQQLQKSKKAIKKQKTPLTNIKEDDNYAGLIPRCAYHLFQCLQTQPKNFNAYCSFLQIYNEKVYDLLQDSPVPNPLVVHESKFQGIFVQGLNQFKIQEYTDCLELMRKGEKNRFIRQTSMNAKSSRSHTIFQILLESSKLNQSGLYTRARLNLCDLAGSQKVNKMEHMVGEHMQELKNINLSLSTLGKVINTLSKGVVKNTAVFRQSKLTRLLQESLIGNTNTFVLGAISPSSKNKDQTLNTLKFVQRARHIKLELKANSISNQGDLVAKLKQQMQQLKKILREKEKQGVPKQIETKLQQLERENNKLKNQTLDKNQNIEKLIEENREVKNALTRMQKVAYEQLSRATLSTVSENGNFFALKPKEEELSKRYRGEDQEDNFGKRQMEPQRSVLPPINKSLHRLNKSLEIAEPEAERKRPNPILNLKNKKSLIDKFELLETRRKLQESKILKGLDTIEQNDNEQERVRSERVKGKKIQMSQGLYSTIDVENEKKGRKRVDFSDRIKELQKKLKKYTK